MLGSFLLYKEQCKLCISEPVLFIGSVVARGTKKIPPGYPGGGRCTPDFKGQILRAFVPTILSIVCTTLLIQSQFDYSDIVWGNCGKTLFDRLQKLQNRAARVSNLFRYDAYANRLFRQLNWKDLSTQFQIQKALMVHKSLNDLVPGYLSSKLLNDVKRATP